MVAILIQALGLVALVALLLWRTAAFVSVFLYVCSFYYLLSIFCNILVFCCEQAVTIMPLPFWRSFKMVTISYTFKFLLNLQ